jgi:glycosyltransferase involved in cell wall biosynthesis
MPPISVVILTKNEERFVGRAIRSAGWADEVLVLDSGSTDDTVRIAESLGARVCHEGWLGWVGQHNLALDLARHDWVFTLDADEIITPELADSIKRAASGPMDPRDGYYCTRKGDFLGVLLPSRSRRARLQRFIRLLNRTHSRYDPALKVHEEVIVSGKSIPLDGILLHWRGYGMDDYVNVFNRYATVEAGVLNERGVRCGVRHVLGMPLLRFLWQYAYQGEWRLGMRGLLHAMLKASAEFVRYAKLWEVQNAAAVLDPPPDVYQPPPEGVPPGLPHPGDTERGSTPVAAGAPLAGRSAEPSA